MKQSSLISEAVGPLWYGYASQGLRAQDQLRCEGLDLRHLGFPLFPLGEAATGRSLATSGIPSDTFVDRFSFGSKNRLF